MLKKNLLVLLLIIVFSTNASGQAYRAYGGYMVGLWAIDWSSLNLQSKPEFGMGKFEKSMFLTSAGWKVSCHRGMRAPQSAEVAQRSFQTPGGDQFLGGEAQGFRFR